MTPIKPGDTLIITELWAAAAAHKLGFELEVMGYKIDQEDWVSWQTFVNYWRPFQFIKARIIVTETGPNAAERFMPMVGDLCQTSTGHDLIHGLSEEEGWFKISLYPDHAQVEVERIIERPHNGEMVPFPTYKIKGQS